MNGDSNGAASDTGALTGTMRVKAGLAQMLKGGVIMGKWAARIILAPADDVIGLRVLVLPLRT